MKLVRRPVKVEAEKIDSISNLPNVLKWMSSHGYWAKTTIIIPSAKSEEMVNNFKVMFDLPNALTAVSGEYVLLDEHGVFSVVNEDALNRLYEEQANV